MKVEIEHDGGDMVIEGVRALLSGGVVRLYFATPGSPAASVSAKIERRDRLRVTAMSAAGSVCRVYVEPYEGPSAAEPVVEQFAVLIRHGDAHYAGQVAAGEQLGPAFSVLLAEEPLCGTKIVTAWPPEPAAVR